MIEATKNNDLGVPLKPHSYPKFFIIITFFTILSFSYFCIVHVPHYRQLLLILNRADKEFCQKNYAKAAKHYEKIFNSLVKDKETLIKISKIYFALNEDNKALRLIKNVSFTSKDYEALLEYMPQKYCFLFDSKSRS